MPLFIMSALILTIMVLFNVLPAVCQELGLKKYELAFFLCSISALYGFTVGFAPEFELNIAIIPVFICALILCFIRNREIAAKVFLPSAVVGITLSVPYYLLENSELLVLLYAFAPLLIALATRNGIAGISAAGMIPVFMEIGRIVLDILESGYGFVIYNSTIADIQLIGVLTAALCAELSAAVAKKKFESGRI